jgi:hypothetical protein
MPVISPSIQKLLIKNFSYVLSAVPAFCLMAPCINSTERGCLNHEAYNLLIIALSEDSLDNLKETKIIKFMDFFKHGVVSYRGEKYSVFCKRSNND